MADRKGLLTTLSTAGFIASFWIVSTSVFFERWKQFVFVSLFWFFFTGKRYRFLYMVLSTFSRDARTIAKYLVTVVPFLYWKYRGGATLSIFLANVQKHPAKVALHFGDEQWTFQQLEDRSNQVANYFKSKGVKRGDTIALFMEGRPQVVCIWLGLCKIGAITALINTNQRSSVLSHSLKAGGCSRVICGTELVEALGEILPDWSHLQVYSSGTSKNVMLGDISDLDQELALTPTTPLLRDVACIDMNDNFLLIYTSGTTGLPKAAKVNHTRYYMMARGVFNMMWMQSNDVVYNTLPLYHTAGGIVGVGQALLNGLTVVIRTKFSASNFWTDCVKYDCTVAQYIGEMCRFLLATPEQPEQKGHKVRLVVGNGMRPQIWQAFVDRFNIQEVGEFYGSTEGNCNMINTENKVGSVGFLPWFATLFNPYYIIKADTETSEPVHNAHGVCIECEFDEPGLLIGKVQKNIFQNFSGYADKKSTDKKILKNVFKKGDLYFNSGDILAKDEFGFFYFRDRTGDTFRWRGENVATSEVEAVISNIVGLKDAIVYGVEIPLVEGKAGMVAIADPDKSLDLELLAQGIRKSLPAYARPLFLRILRNVPITGTFKLQKIYMQKEGYNPSKLKDSLYYFNGTVFLSLTEELYESIISGQMKL